MVRKNLQEELHALIDSLRVACEVINSINDYLIDFYHGLALECEVALRILPEIISNGDFVSEKARRATLNLLRNGAAAISDNGFPFLGLEIEREIQAIGSDGA